MTTETELIDTTSRLQSFLDSIPPDTSKPPILYVDLEGNNLSRHSTLSLVTIFVEPKDKVYFVDVTTLQHNAFDTAGSNGRTLRTVLESKDVIKVFFDIRNDSDALFSLYGVRVGGIEDLQLIELASRTFDKRHLNGLAKCIERDSTIGYNEKQEWKNVKEKGKTLFDPRYGGSYAVFDERPLSPEIHTYCVQDVTLMPHLRTIYRTKLCDAWWKKIKKETQVRIRLSQSANFNGKGQHMA
jgi:exonuclease 3'-5' domain-containing protein 1